MTESSNDTVAAIVERLQAIETTAGSLADSVEARRCQPAYSEEKLARIERLVQTARDLDETARAHADD